MEDLQPEDIQEILRIFAESELEELRLEVGETRLHVSKSDTGTSWEERPPRIGGRSAGEPSESRATKSGSAEAAAEGPATSQLPAAAGTAESTSAAAPVEGLADLRSPLLGVFYRRPSPDKPPFVEVGAAVEPDDPVCIVDVMKMFTQIPAGTRGRIAEICVEDGQLVEHGQVLMRIEPTEEQ